jgi:hypothetical protein
MTAARLTLPTQCAHWGWVDHRYFGHSVFGELTGRETMTSISALAVLGRKLSKECCDVLDDIVCTSTLADPRIWPLKMTRLISAYGTVMPAAAAGLLIQEGTCLGPWTIGDSAVVLAELRRRAYGNETNPAYVLNVVQSYLREYRRVLGFGTPFRDRDERLTAFQERMRLKNRNTLPHWLFMEQVVQAVQSLKQVEPNISLVMGAVLLDMDITPEEIGPLVTSLCHHMFFANAVEGARQAPRALRHLPAECISYVGRAARRSPRFDERVSMVRLSSSGHR